MASTIFALLIVLGFALYIMTGAERMRLVRSVLTIIRQVLYGATHDPPECKPFRDALRARTPWAFITGGLAALNAAVFIRMVFGPGALGDPETLVGWGASFGPRTARGEWWRLVTAMFVHSGTLHLLANLAALVPLGLLLERLVGHYAFAAVYVATGILAGLASISSYPVSVSAGASGAIFGLYGLLCATVTWELLRHSGKASTQIVEWLRSVRQTLLNGAAPRRSVAAAADITSVFPAEFEQTETTAVSIPAMSLKRLVPAAALFLICNLANDALGIAAELMGLAAGFVGGLVLAKGVGESPTPARAVSAAMAVTAAIAVAAAVALHGLTDVRPEIARIVALEEKTVDAYRMGVDRVRGGRIQVEALAQLIDRTIVPELRATEQHLKGLAGVPRQQRPLLEGAEEYVRLRQQAWRLRAEGLRMTNRLTHAPAEGIERATDERRRRRAESQHRANMRTLGKAETAERASLELLERIKAAVAPEPDRAAAKAVTAAK